MHQANISLTTMVFHLRCSGQDQSKNLPSLNVSFVGFKLCLIFCGKIHFKNAWVVVFVSVAITYHSFALSVENVPLKPWSVLWSFVAVEKFP